jgi:hypothetical protein
VTVRNKPARWKASDEALRAVQVAFDVEETVLNAVRQAAFVNQLSSSDQIRRLLDLPTPNKPKRPRLTVSLSAQDYELLGARYGLASDDRLSIKEHVTAELIAFSKGQGKRR